LAKTGKPTLAGDDLARYSRNVLVKEIGVKGQKKLLNSRVLVVGAGGLGSPAALYLAAAGVGAIGLADGDEVELSNLQRQILHGARDLGRPKVESGRAALLALNPKIEVVTHGWRVGADDVLSLVAGYDFVLDGSDNFPTKFTLNDACVLLNKPFCHAGVLRFQGQLFTRLPGGPCLRCLFEGPPSPGSVPTCGQAGIVGAAAGVVGSLMALEAIKYLTGAGDLLNGVMLTFDGLAMEFRRVKFPKRADCPVCGANPTILKLE
jgi:molybdopterin/thiamine biosynthesis adenylyltransferase